MCILKYLYFFKHELYTLLDQKHLKHFDWGCLHRILLNILKQYNSV